MTPDQIAILELEGYYRTLFQMSPEELLESGTEIPPPVSRSPLAPNPSPLDLENQHILLHDVFDNLDNFLWEGETEEEIKMKSVLQPNADLLSELPMREVGHRVVNNRTTFLEKWNEFTFGKSFISMDLNFRNI